MKLNNNQAAFVLSSTGDAELLLPEIHMLDHDGKPDDVPEFILALMEIFHQFKAENIPSLARAFIARTAKGETVQ